MTTTTIIQREVIPASYPPTPEGLSADAAALSDTVWQRIENYVAHRWSERAVIWTVEGPGNWRPPLTPATITTVEIWQPDGWQETDIPASAYGGFILPGCGPYRFTGTAGSDEAVPAAVNEAFKRLAEYLAQKPGKAGATSERVSAGIVSISTRRSASWAAQAVQNSGAGDLLRPYRRA